MAISTVGVGYKFLPPIIRPDTDAASGKPADTSRGGTTGTTAVPNAAPAVSAADSSVEHANTGKHLLRIVV